MIDEQHPPDSHVMTAPPSVPGAMPTSTSAWPTVIGVLMTVLSSLGMLMYGCGAIWNAIWPAISAKISQTTAGGNKTFEAQLEVMRHYLPWNIVNAIVMVGLSAMLLMTGIGLLRRRRWSMRIGITWAVTRILWAVPASWVGYLIAIETFETMEKAAADAGQPMPAGINGMLHAFGVGGIVLGALFVSALPAFVLIWFSRSKIRNEVAQWS